MHNALLAVVLLIWILLGIKMNSDWNACCKDAEPIESPGEISSESESGSSEVICPDVPICFLDNQSSPSFGSGFDAMRDSLVSLVGEGQKLRIIGSYGSVEENTSSFENLGIGRAEAVKSQFISQLSGDRIETGGQLTVGQSGESTGFTSNPVSFDIVGEGAAEIATSTIIYFAFNSTDKLDDSVVEQYLQSVVERVASSNERVQVTGHTDALGEESSNRDLGMRRAEVIRDFLVASKRTFLGTIG